MQTSWFAVALIVFRVALSHLPDAADISATGLRCPTCNPSNCTTPSGCPAGVTLDPCGCCDVCTKVIRETCGGPWNMGGVCDQAHNLLCIPIDPYSTSQLGTCQEITSCLAFGCDIEDGHCHCRYSNVCPVPQFSYATIDDCEENVQKSACEMVNCPLEECPEGMIYDPGFVTPGECCPSGGTCICDRSQCEVCSPGSELVVVVPANETAGQCCDVIKCTTVLTNCSNGDREFADGERWHKDPCTECMCNNGSWQCAQESCPPLECEDRWRVVPDGHCCAVCFPITQILPTVLYNCVSSSGKTFTDGERWSEEPCSNCLCRDGRKLCNTVYCEPAACRNPVSIPGACCPACLDPESSAGPDNTTMQPHPVTTGPPSPVIHTMEIPVAFILDLPFELYVSHGLQLLKHLKDVLENGEVEAVEMMASAYGSSQTHLVVVLRSRNASTAEDVVSMVSERTMGLGIVLRVGALSDIPGDETSMPLLPLAPWATAATSIEVTHELFPTSTSRPTLVEDSFTVVLATTLSVLLGVATVSLIGILVMAAVFVQRRKKSGKDKKPTDV